MSYVSAAEKAWPYPERIDQVYEKLPVDGETVEFRLFFRGFLPSARRAGIEAKHQIRRYLHPQLRSLWQQHPALKGAFTSFGGQASGIERLGNTWSRCGFRFIPLIKKEHFACELDILILHAQDPIHLFSPLGDLDNRVKTLLDGLRMPDQCSEVEGQSPSVDENPFYVLMDDDSAVFKVHMDVDKLLLPVPSQVEPIESDYDTIATIGVRVTTFMKAPIAYFTAGFF